MDFKNWDSNEVPFLQKNIAYMISENTTPDEIIQILKKCGSTNLTKPRFKNFIRDVLYEEWDSNNGCWKEIKKTELNLSPSQTLNKDNNFIIKIDSHNIPSYIKELPLPNSAIKKGTDLNILSSNDIATLWKNIYDLESRLNKTIRNINTIIKMITVKSTETEFNNIISKEVLVSASSFDSPKCILENMATINCKLKKINKTIDDISKTFISE